MAPCAKVSSATLHGLAVVLPSSCFDLWNSFPPFRPPWCRSYSRSVIYYLREMKIRLQASKKWGPAYSQTESSIKVKLWRTSGMVLGEQKSAVTIMRATGARICRLASVESSLLMETITKANRKMGRPQEKEFSFLVPIATMASGKKTWSMVGDWRCCKASLFTKEASKKTRNRAQGSWQTCKRGQYTLGTSKTES